MAANRRAHLADTWLVAGAAFALYLLLGQRALHGDGAYFLVWAERGVVTHPHHFSYLPLLRGWTWLLGQLGYSVYDAALLLSQATTAGAVAICHRAAARLGLARNEALLAASMIAFCPAVLYFATVVELHAPFLLWCAVATYAGTRLAIAPSLGLGLGLGLACGAAYLAHASGVILLGLHALLVLVLAPGPRRALVAPLALAVAALAAVVLVGTSTLRHAGFAVDPAKATGFIAFWSGSAPLTGTRLLGAFAHEWLWSFAPLSVLHVFALTFRPTRALALATLLALVPYLLSVALILAPAELREHGAYLLPLVWPFALLAVRMLPVRLAELALVVTVVLGVLQVRQHDDDQARAWARGLREAAGGRPAFVFIASAEDFAGRFVGAPRVPFFAHVDLAQYVEPEPLRAAAIADLDQRIGALLAAGTRVYVTHGFEAFVTDPANAGGFPGLRATLQHLRTRWQLVEVAAAGFRGHEVRAHD